MTPPRTVDEYINAQSALTQTRLREIRAIVQEVVPEATETISYGMPTYRLGTSPVAHFAAAKNHCAWYGAVRPEFAADLTPYSTARGTIRFPLDQPIPADLIRRLLRARDSRSSSARPL
ncbi:MAG: hypothetical protein NVSMB2_02690 [Chloroflexota bacterium]